MNKSTDGRSELGEMSTFSIVLKDGQLYDIEDEVGDVIASDLDGPPDMGPNEQWMDEIIDHETVGQTIPIERQKIIWRTALTAANRPDEMIRDERTGVNHTPQN